MTFNRLKRYNVIEVVWLDSWAPTDKWVPELLHNEKAIQVKTIAIFWSQTKDYICTYGSVTLTDGDVMLGNPFNIPKGCIKSMVILK